MFSIEKDFDPSILTNMFDERVRLSCTFCKRYGTKATCPPHIESVPYYKSILPCYNAGKLLLHKFQFTPCENTCGTIDDSWQNLGKESTKRLNTHVLSYRAKLWSEGHYLLMGFGAGSCKLCEKCTFPCRYPDKSLIPIEGTGLRVDELVLTLTGIQLKFPIEQSFYRIGILLYD